MTVSKRVRFEVLRRDEHTCQYCGHRPPDVRLQVDHVVPVALGGSDDPTNLVTACAGCNQGKASIAANAEIVAAVDAKAEIWKAAQRKAMDELATELDDQARYEQEVVAVWEHYTPQFRRPPLGDSFARSVYDWHANGVPISVVEKGIRIAIGNRHIAVNAKWDYAAGVVRQTVSDAQRRFDVDPETGNTREYDRGWAAGAEDQARADTAYYWTLHWADEALIRHVDGGEPFLMSARKPTAA